MYEIIGKAAVKGIVLMVRLRYGRQLRIALALGVVATRDRWLPGADQGRGSGGLSRSPRQRTWQRRQCMTRGRSSPMPRRQTRHTCGGFAA